VSGVSYVAFVDPSGGSADSMTLAIGHKQDDVSILDAVRVIRRRTLTPPILDLSVHYHADRHRDPICGRPPPRKSVFAVICSDRLRPYVRPHMMVSPSRTNLGRP
jgi:hypothetical protein